MSIFDTKPPSIDRDKLNFFLENNYDFLKNKISSSEKLNSERDYNLKIFTKDKKKFVVKISNSSENIKILKLQDSILSYLSHQPIKENIPQIMHGKINTIYDINNKKCYIRILSFLEGDMFADKQNNDELCLNLAIFLGNLSLSLKDFKNSSAKRVFIWDSSNINWIKQKINLFEDKNKLKVFSAVLKSYESNFENIKDNLRYSVIHGDSNNYNIVVKENKVVGLLDYGDVVYAPTVCELSVALAYSLMNCDDIIKRCLMMVRAYNDVFPLKKNEIKSISTLIASRLLITVTMAMTQKIKYPENKYLTISEKDAWKLLYKLTKISLDEITNLLLDNNNER